MRKIGIGCLLVIAFATTVPAQNRARMDILLPEKTRLLTRQRIDLVVEVRSVDTPSHFKVTANGSDITARFAPPVKAELDCNGTAGLVDRADGFEFLDGGNTKLTVELQNGNDLLRAERNSDIQPFTL